MSSPKYASPLVLKPVASRYFTGLFLTGHLGAMMVVLPLSFAAGVKITILIILLVSLLVVMRSRGLSSVKTLTWKESGDWVLVLADDTQYETRLMPSSYVSPWLVVLNFDRVAASKRRSATLFRDALDQESFRQLRVRLGMEGTGIR